MEEFQWTMKDRQEEWKIQVEQPIKDKKPTKDKWLAKEKQPAEAGSS
jgi:hypothetical protein